jgi:hypothetical protein
MSEPAEILSHPAVLPSVLGALVGLKFAPGATYPQRLSNFVCGATIARFGGPAAIEFFGQDPEGGMATFIIFTIGLFGLSLADAIYRGIKETKFSELITGLFPGSKG